jgi:hypothetical protein
LPDSFKETSKQGEPDIYILQKCATTHFKKTILRCQLKSSKKAIAIKRTQFYIHDKETFARFCKVQKNTFVTIFLCLGLIVTFSCGQRLSNGFSPLRRTCGLLPTGIHENSAVGVEVFDSQGERMRGRAAQELLARVYQGEDSYAPLLAGEGCIMLKESSQPQTLFLEHPKTQEKAIVEFSRTNQGLELRRVLLSRAPFSVPRLVCPREGIYTNGKFPVPFEFEESAHKAGYETIVTLRSAEQGNELTRTRWKGMLEKHFPHQQEKILEFATTGQYYLAVETKDSFARTLSALDDKNSCPVTIIKDLPFVIDSRTKEVADKGLLAPGEALAWQASPGATLFSCFENISENSCEDRSKFRAEPELRFAPGVYRVRAFARDKAGNESTIHVAMIRVAGLKPQLLVNWKVPTQKTPLGVLHEPHTYFSASVALNDLGIPQDLLEQTLECKVELRRNGIIEDQTGAICIDNKCLGEFMSFYVPCSKNPTFRITNDWSTLLDRALVLKVRVTTPFGVQVEDDATFRFHANTFAFPKIELEVQKGTENAITQMFAGSQGEVFAVSKASLHVMHEGGIWTPLLSPLPDARFATVTRAALDKMATGLWLLHDGGVSFVNAKNEWKTFDFTGLDCEGPCNNLFVDLNGNVWIFGQQKSIRLQNGTWNSFDLLNASIDHKIAFPYELDDGELRVLTTRGRYALRENGFIPLPWTSDDMTFDNFPEDAHFMQNGERFFRTEGREAFLDRFIFGRDEKWNLIRTNKAGAFNLWSVSHSLTNASGSVLTLDSGTLLSEQPDGSTLAYVGKSIDPDLKNGQPLQVTAFLTQKNGQTLVALKNSYRGQSGDTFLARMPPPASHRIQIFNGQSLGDMPDFLYDFYLNQKGAPWVLSPWQYALYKVDSQGLLPFRSRVDSLPFRHIYSFLFENEQLKWIAGDESLYSTQHGLRIAVLDKETWREFPTLGKAMQITGNSDLGSLKLFQGRENDVWLTTYKNGIARYKNETWEIWPSEEGKLRGVRGREQFCISRDGSAWAIDSVEQSLWQFQQRWERVDLQAIPSKPIALACDTQSNSVWILSYNELGTPVLFLFENGMWRQISVPLTFYFGDPPHIGASAQGGVWMLTNGGVLAWQNSSSEWSVLKLAEHSALNLNARTSGFFATLRDDYFWFTSQQGLVSVKLIGPH